MSAEVVRIPARRPARRLFVHQLRSEQLVFWRSREAAFFIFLFPLLRMKASVRGPGSTPASRQATYASIEVERSGGPSNQIAHVVLMSHSEQLIAHFQARSPGESR